MHKCRGVGGEVDGLEKYLGARTDKVCEKR